MTKAELLKIAKPILFNTEMTVAILEDKKGVTRRLGGWKIGQLHTDRNGVVTATVYRESKKGKTVTHFAGGTIKQFIEAFSDYQLGDILYVRETWRVGAWDVINHTIAFDYRDGTCGKLIYMHDRELFDRLVNQSRDDARELGCVYNGVDFVWEKGKSPCRWRPSIHMPKEAARIFLKVKDVRVEHLDDMKVEDAVREGVNMDGLVTNQGIIEYRVWNRWNELWDSTIPKKDLDKYGSEANPWVWVIEFERIMPESEV